MQSCIKKNTVLTKRDEALWYFWIETMKLNEKWFPHISNKPGEITICYECEKLSSDLRWINPASYDIVSDNVVRNIYCNDCYSEWIKNEIKNETKNETKNELDETKDEAKNELDEIKSKESP